MRDRGAFLLSTTLLGCLFAALIILPLIALVAFGLREGALGTLNSEESRSAMGISLRTTFVSTAVMTVLGVPLAIRIVRSRKWARGILEALVSLPLVLPPAAAGLALLLAFGKRGMLGPFLDQAGISIAFSPTAVVLAQVFVASPFFLRSAIEAFDAVDPDLLGHSALDGANPSQSLRLIVLPLALPGLASGLLTAWARALGEFGATILFAGNLMGVTQTMPLAIYLGFETDLTRAAGLAILMLLVAACVLAAGKVFTLWKRS